MFDHIKNWTLKAGSHDFPGPDGGTSINEAAIIAAGFEYRKVRSADDCPPCFSRVASAYAIRINDRMPDDLRQRLLMPFVMRLSGSADTEVVERQRADFIAIQTVRRVLPIALRAAGLNSRASECEGVTTMDDARSAAKAAANSATAANAAASYANPASYAANAAARAAANAAANAAAVNASAAAAVWPIVAEILDGALHIGNQAPPADTAQIVARFNAAKAMAHA